MLKAELPIKMIAEMFSKEHFPFSQKTLLICQEYENPIGIFVPHYQKNMRYWSGRFQNLLQKNILDQVSILDITPGNLKKSFVRHIIFNSSGCFKVLGTFFFSDLEMQNYYHQIKSQSRYITFIIPKKFLNRLSHYPTPFHFVENTYFPSPRALPIHKVALLYDEKVENSYQEVKEIYDCLTTHFTPLLEVSIAAISEHGLYDIMASHDFIHYAGHVGKKNPFAGYIPKPSQQLRTQPRFIFLNGCKTPPDFLDYCSIWDITTIFSNEVQLDNLIPIEQILLVYMGLFLGIRFGDLMNHLPRHMRILGYAHHRIAGVTHGS